MAMPFLPHWNKGVIAVYWRAGRQESAPGGHWILPIADALAQGEKFVSPGKASPAFGLQASLLPEGKGWRLIFKLCAEQRFWLSQVQLRVPLPDNVPEHMFCNGWQSWSESREFHRSERIAQPRWIARKLFQPYGDGAALRQFASYSWQSGARYDGQPGHQHSWSWTSWPLPGAAIPPDGETGKQMAGPEVSEHEATGQKATGPELTGPGFAGRPDHGSTAQGKNTGDIPLNQSRPVVFLGSLNEQDAYTCFSQHFPGSGNGFLQISRDVPADWEAVAAGQPDSAKDEESNSSADPEKEEQQSGVAGRRWPFARTLLDVFWAEGEERAVYDDWFKALGISAHPPAAPDVQPTSGWTSWYRHYNRINASLLGAELTGLAKAEPKPQWFQIDDGWQPRVGDWTETKPTFPQGLKPLADQARQLGFKPGLWLAPFVAEKRSTLLREHPEWAERDEHGNWVAAGFNPLWSGTFYALNPDHPGLRQHLSNVFNLLLNDWGFEGLKLDFLYAAGLQHRQGRSRAARMRSAMEFLREAAGDRFLLGCGVPLAPAFGLVDACRIGADVHLAWEHRLLAFLRNRERVSTRLAVLTTVGRRLLNGRAFTSDPDVYLMRFGDPALKLNEAEQLTLLVLNRLFGGLLFHSDAPSGYLPATRDLLKSILAPGAVSYVRVLPATAADARNSSERICASFLSNGERCIALLNLGEKPWTLCLEHYCGEFEGLASALWQSDLPALGSGQVLQLEPHCCRVFQLPAESSSWVN